MALLVKNASANAGDMGSIPGLGRSPGEGNVNLLQDSCLENPKDRGAWWATGHGPAETDTTEGCLKGVSRCLMNSREGTEKGSGPETAAYEESFSSLVSSN